MSDKISANPNLIPDVEFNLDAQEQFIQDKGILLEHWAAIPTPIGLKDRGDYRRSDALDTISSNGFIYKKVGDFKGVLVNNGRKNDPIDGGIYDNSTARLVLPKYYTTHISGSCPELSFLPGDRVYAKNIELKVDNYQRVEYVPSAVDYLQFPAKSVSYLIDSRGEEYVQGRHFCITNDGNVKWIDGQKNPGVDVETGKGRIYSARYTYLAFWYVLQLVNEIRITSQGSGDTATRLPYQVMLQREYIYHNQNRGDAKNSNPKTYSSRTKEKPTEVLNNENYEVKVDISQFE